MRILESVAAPGATDKFIDQVVRFSPQNNKFLYFKWTTALIARYDVFHIHWPEALVRGRSPVHVASKRMALLLVLLKCKMLGTPLVRTVHNLQPHSPANKSEKWWLQLIESQTRVEVHLNPCTPRRTGVTTTIIPHAHYREQVRAHAPQLADPGRLLAIGRIQQYKQVPELIRSFRAGGLPGNHLRIVGKATIELDGIIRREVETWDAMDLFLSVNLDFVSDAQMATEILQSECIMLTYSEMHNSGIALLALSMNRPIVMPRNCANEYLAMEVGDSWVHLYDGEFTQHHFAAVREFLRRPRPGSPKLSDRDWPAIAQEYSKVFSGAVSPRR